MGGGYFAGAFAGEHVAATEFVIGAMFVTWGARIFDIVVGLAVGNLLAVLSWAFVCAPIAVRIRLTLYWTLRKTGGPVVALIYNLINAFLFCVLAGCMITVSASAVRLPFGIPEQTHWFPTHAGFVFVVLGVGAVVVTLAIAGFKRLALFSSVCSPWMLLMFVAGALVMLPRLGLASGAGQIKTLADFWDAAGRTVWTGRAAGGGPPIGFAHIAAFAWICNLAMHLGLSDMALFRFARRSAYGFYSAFGMILGHYLAWICAGVMGAGVAFTLNTPLTQLDSGTVAFQALGVSGAIAVVVAGWTTSNPTLYRAGLALQAVTPDWPRWKVTLFTGAVTTLIACFPFVFTRLLDFVSIYGLILAPVGAVVLTEYRLLPKWGIRTFEESGKNRLINGPALAAWGSGIVLALALHFAAGVHLFFLFLPAYLSAAVFYAALSRIARYRRAGNAESVQKTAFPPGSGMTHSKGHLTAEKMRKRRSPVRWITGGVALAALVFCLVMAVRVFQAGSPDTGAQLEWFRKWLIVPTLVYFIAGTGWALLREK